MPVVFSVESFRANEAEIVALGAEHEAEVGPYGGAFPFRPNLAAHEAMEDHGALHMFVAKDGGKIVGYVLSFVMPHLHYSIPWATGELFLRKSHRGPRVADRLLAFAEDGLRAKGVLLVSIGVHPDHPNLGRLLMRRDYQLSGLYYSRRL
jgi:GNAT superfamily N-acetyltransferase